MLHVKHYPFDLAFKYPFTTNKGTKTHQPILVVSLGVGPLVGFGEAPAISYHNITVEGMVELLESKKAVLQRYALIDPKRFWHFLHHLIPDNNFLIAALDIAAWDLFSKMRRKPLYQMLGLTWQNTPITDYTIGLESAPEMVAKIKANHWPLYKIKLGKPDDIDLLRAIRKETDAKLRVDANEGWQLEDAKKLLPELEALGVQLLEQPLHRNEREAMEELKAMANIPLFADESCQTEKDIEHCAKGFDGVNIKLTKCGGITPALEMIDKAKKLRLKVMIGSMCESTLGSAAIAHMLPLLDEVDADGPLLLKEDLATGLSYNQGVITVSEAAGLGIQFKGHKFERQ